MTRNEIISKIQELEELILMANTDLRRQLLGDYSLSLKTVNDGELFDHLLEVQDRIDNARGRLLKSSEQEFNEYCALLDVWGELYEELLK